MSDNLLHKKISDWFITIPMATLGSVGIFFLVTINSQTLNPEIGVFLWIRAIAEDILHIVKKEDFPPFFIYLYALLQWSYAYLAYYVLNGHPETKAHQAIIWILVDAISSIGLFLYNKRTSRVYLNQDIYIKRLMLSALSLGIIFSLYIFLITPLL